MMRNWFNERSRQEQIVLALGACIVLAALYFVVLIEPLMNANDRYATRLKAEQVLHAHLHQVQREATALRARQLSAASVPPGALMSLLTTTAEASGVQANTRRVTPLGADAVSIVVEALPFTTLTTWLVGLRSEHGVEIEQAAITGGDGDPRGCERGGSGLSSRSQCRAALENS